jgi:hypothetical protein
MKPNQVFEDLPIFTMLEDLLLTATRPPIANLL